MAEKKALRRRLGSVGLVRSLYQLRILARNREVALRKPLGSLQYLFGSRELDDNFTYELANVDEMVGVLTAVLAIERNRVTAYLDELYGDEDFREQLSAILKEDPRRNNTPSYGKRAMDYCVVRATQPTTVVELGTFDGLASALILRALQRNAAEGHEGSLHTFDVDGEAGWLVPHSLRDRMTLHVGDARQTLEPVLAEHGVDAVNSDFGPCYDGKPWALETICDHARGELVIRDEESDGTLPRLAAERGARHGSFREEPLRHFWPGNLVGLAAFPAAAGPG